MTPERFQEFKRWEEQEDDTIISRTLSELLAEIERLETQLNTRRELRHKAFYLLEIKEKRIAELEAECKTIQENADGLRQAKSEIFEQFQTSQRALKAKDEEIQRLRAVLIKINEWSITFGNGFQGDSIVAEALKPAGETA